MLSTVVLTQWCPSVRKLFGHSVIWRSCACSTGKQGMATSEIDSDDVNRPSRVWEIGCQGTESCIGEWSQQRRLMVREPVIDPYLVVHSIGPVTPSERRWSDLSLQG